MSISLYEVGLRDGLQNHHQIIPTDTKLELISLLAECGINNAEIASFVHPKRVPAMADADLLFKELDGNYAGLIPNQKGFDRAIKAGCENFNIFFSPSNSFNEKNVGVRDFRTLLQNYELMLADVHPSKVRVYISTAFGCPLEGEISQPMLDVCIQEALDLGSTIVLCDTVGKATPDSVKLLSRLATSYTDNIAMHFHHGGVTSPHILENVAMAYENGVSEFDCSLGGLGGCNFIPESGGNLATEVLLDWACTQDIDTGIFDLDPALHFMHKFVI